MINLKTAKALGLTIPPAVLARADELISVVDRRTFTRGAFALLAASVAARAQQTRKVYRIGILGQGVGAEMAGPQPRNPFSNALVRGLRELGYVYGEHFVTESRGGEGRLERYPVLATELVRLQVDVIVAAGPVLPALRQATSMIPIVMAGSSDPVGRGARTKPRTSGRERHGPEPSAGRDDGEAP